MMKRIFAISLLVLATGCGKNDPIRGVNPPPASPGAPVVQAPPPAGNYPPPGGFYPSMPPGYGPQFTPFLPIYQHYPQPVFQQIWVGWQNYCQTYGIPVYDFSTFWFEYCPSAVPYDYYYLDYSYYSWVDPYTTFSPYCDPYTFWQGYY